MHLHHFSVVVVEEVEQVLKADCEGAVPGVLLPEI